MIVGEVDFNFVVDFYYFVVDSVVNIILVIDSIFVVNSNLIVPTKGSNLVVEEVDSNLLLIKNSCEGCCRFWKKLGYNH